MSDTSLVFSLIARDLTSPVLKRVREKFSEAGAKAGKAMAAGFGVGVAPAAVTAVAGVAAGAVAAGAAVQAFAVAAGPQLDSVSQAWELYSKSQDPAIKGTKAAEQATKRYQATLAAMPPATRATATAFVGLKNDVSKWSDSLSSTTMPVFTKGITILRDLLPTLTPFVRAAAGAIGGFLDDVSAGVKSAGFKQWASDMSAAAGPALSNFLTVIKNLAIGFGALLQAFLPVSGQMTGGLAGMSQAFADWATHVKDTEGFSQFMSMARDGGGALGNLAKAVGQLLVAMRPLMGTTALVAQGLTKIINNTPTPILTALAGVLLTVKLGMMAYSLVSSIVAAKNAVMAASQTSVIAGWIRMNAVGVAAMLRIAATSAIAAAQTAAAWVGNALVSIGTWIAAVIRAGVTAAAQFLLMAGRAIVWAATMAAQWFIAMGPIGWVIAAVVALVVLIIANWAKVKAWTMAIFNAVWGFIKRVWSGIKNWVVSTVASVVSWVQTRWTAFKAVTMAVFNAIRSKISGAINGAKNAVMSAVQRIGSFISSIKSRVMGALSGAGSWLINSGRSIIRGLISGIKGMIGNAVSAVKSGLSRIRNLLPFSPAKEGPFSGKGWTLYSGQALMQGLAEGIQRRQHLAASAMSRAAQGVSAAAPGAAQGAMAPPRSTPVASPVARAAGGGTVTVRFEFNGADGEFKKLMRKIVRVDGRGDVQVAFGRG